MSFSKTTRVVLLALAAGIGAVHAADSIPLTIETRIPLGKVPGKIDHLAYDPARERLYVAELGNNSVGIVDLKSGRLPRTVRGFDAPQGLGYEPATDTIYVANGGDGSVRVFSGAAFEPLGAIALGADADNVRVDTTARRVYVGYGNGAIAVVDPVTRKRIADIPLNGHPESFQLEPDGRRIFVNIPDAHHITIVSRAPGSEVATWPIGDLRANYPLALDAARMRTIVVFRQPARLRAYEWNTGRVATDIEVCADSDDLFVDSRRARLYVICGEGLIETFDASTDEYSRSGMLTSSSGSRTGLFVPAVDRLLVAIRAARGEPAAIWVLRPNP